MAEPKLQTVGEELDDFIDYDAADVDALARRARLPADEPGVAIFAKLIVRQCAWIASNVKPTDDLDWVPEHTVRAVTDEVVRQILTRLDAHTDRMRGDSTWFDRSCRQSLTFEPRQARDDCRDWTRIIWVERFAGRLHELHPDRSTEDCAVIADEEAERLLGYEPGFAATLWFNEDERAAT